MEVDAEKSQLKQLVLALVANCVHIKRDHARARELLF